MINCQNYKTYAIIGIVLALVFLIYYCYTEHFGVTINTGNPVVDVPANDLSNFVESLVELSQANTKATLLLAQTVKKLPSGQKKELIKVSQNLDNSYKKAIDSLNSLKTMANDMVAASRTNDMQAASKENNNIEIVREQPTNVILSENSTYQKF
jgi:hypothetical protein